MIQAERWFGADRWPALHGEAVCCVAVCCRCGSSSSGKCVRGLHADRCDRIAPDSGLPHALAGVGPGHAS